MRPKRTALLGATSLQGKDLLQRLEGERERLGTLVMAESGLEESVATPVAGEWLVSTPLMDEALEGADLVLCCARLDGEAREAVRQASAKAVVVDLAGSFDAPVFDARRGVTLATLGHGLHASPKGASLLAAALARGALRAGARAPLFGVACEPASELGQSAVDELYAQAVALLSFKPLPTEIFGRQAVHDVLSPGPDGPATEARIRREVKQLVAADVSLLVVRPGLFHGSGVGLHARVAAADWRRALADEPRLELAAEGEQASPAAAVASEQAVVGRLEDDGFGGAWAWAAADTLAHGAVGNVVEMILAS